MTPRSAALGQEYPPPAEETNLNRVEAIIRAQYATHRETISRLRHERNGVPRIEPTRDD